MHLFIKFYIYKLQEKKKQIHKHCIGLLLIWTISNFLEMVQLLCWTISMYGQEEVVPITLGSKEDNPFYDVHDCASCDALTRCTICNL